MRKPSGRIRLSSPWLAAVVACAGCDGLPIVDHGIDAGASTDVRMTFNCVSTDAPAGFVPVSVASAVTKVKTLLVGLAPTEAEVNAVAADPAALDGLVSQWMTLPQYSDKMLHFFVTAFQQDQISYAQLMLPSTGFGFSLQDNAEIIQNMQESFARTVMELIAEGQPFTAAITTHRYMMTPAVMAAYAILDTFDFGDNSSLVDFFEQEHPVQVTVESSHPVPIESAIDPTSPDFMTFYNPSLATSTPPGCPSGSITYPSPAPYEAVAAAIYSGTVWIPANATGTGNCQMPPEVPTEDRYLTATDFTQWQMVTTRLPNPGESTTLLYDLPAMRAGHDLVLRIPRVGFFTTPAFFARWPTNVNNQARVLLNQTMIVALGTPIDLTNASIPADLSAIDTAHAAPGTECYGCHVSLDPMRQYFRHAFTLYGNLQTDPTQLSMLGQFAFHGVTSTGTAGLDDLAAHLATHPLFPTAWVQRLCTYATSAPCLETDPEFVRLVNLFVSSNYSWSALVQALFASPLVTYLTPTLTARLNGQTFPVTRQEHLCALLSARLGLVDLCGLEVTATTQSTTVSPVAQTLAPSWPSGQYSRGVPTPSLAREPSLLLRGGLENICADLARMFVTTDPSSMFPVGNPSMAIQNVATQLMGLSGARVAGPLGILQQHYSAAVQTGASVSASLQSTFVLGCTSPYVAGMGQ